ncbi:hypothetical protein CSOJ01_15156 [Colletotrichum sojae]|uniref:Uncharacterized protein n=1 Tax=Colletotrichum sojae TaxID=2175907 RepID=A0A8H6INT1_9PEZI|nr:hypothetical protein CSOJ01_15156 [Colletotrichum sojae]
MPALKNAIVDAKTKQRLQPPGKSVVLPVEIVGGWQETEHTTSKNVATTNPIASRRAANITRAVTPKSHRRLRAA